MEKYVFQSLSFKYLPLRSRKINFMTLSLDSDTQKKSLLYAKVDIIPTKQKKQKLF